MANQELIEIMRNDKPVRRSIVRRSHKLFFLYYFGHYIEYALAPFHEEFFKLTHDETHSMIVVSAFRNSGKSTIFTLSYPIWAIISGKAKYILIVSETQQKAQQLLSHIKAELTENELLKNDLGPFQEERVGWNSISLTLKNYDAKITAVSTEQSVRGVRHKNHRPDLIILDDCESQDSVRTQESRDKLSSWLSGDVIPAGHLRTKIVVIGSMLHLDSLLPRLIAQIESQAISGLYSLTPILNEHSKPAWPGKFPDMEAIEKEKARGINERDWLIEYLLTPITSEDQVIKKDDIHYYEHLPAPDSRNSEYVASAVDLAISKNDTADYTAIVSGTVVRDREGWRLYIHEHPINERLNGAEVEERIVQQSLVLGNGQPTQMFIENVGYQQMMVERVSARGIPVEGFSPGGNDKRARLISASGLIKSGHVLLPQYHAGKLINQVLYFGSEKHDDLLDAFVILVLKVFEREEKERIIMPQIPELQAKSRQEEEQLEDEMASLRQMGMRGDQYFLDRFYDLQRKRDAETWKQEELREYSRLMRGSMHARRRGY